MPDRVVVRKDQSGAWYWLRIGGNNEPLSKSSESYVNKGHAVEQASELNAGVEVQVEE